MLAGAGGCAPPPPPPGCRLAAIIWFILVSNSGAVSQQGHGHTYICCMFGSDSIVVAMFIRAGLFRNAPRSGMPGNIHHRVMRLLMRSRGQDSPPGPPMPGIPGIPGKPGKPGLAGLTPELTLSSAIWRLDL